MICDVSVRTGMHVDDILGRSRIQDIALVRQLYWKLLRMKKSYSFKTIGRLCERNHSTIVNGIKHVDSLLEINDEYAVKMWNKVKDIEA
ncbi:helix-turn-helix domain-containing protein [Proteiniphilum sp.]|uniref:helix-turn-helix domain-containing protein n=1 Tax=Proteiniphilum sp. TaxID=1926877 RepID=UPI003A599047